MLAVGRVIRLGGGGVQDTYLDADKIIAAAQAAGADAVHPGYGFLSENADFAERLNRSGITFIGPRPEHIRAFGLKHSAREIALACGVRLLQGSGVLRHFDEAMAEAARIGYPVMLKSTAGGGGVGMQLCHSPEELADRFDRVARLAASNFGDGRLYIERYVASSRHIEVQIFGDGKGGVVTLGERDCSLQRRHQKVVEEAPAPNLSQSLRRYVHDAAIALARHVNYASAGTVEFVYDVERAEAYFLEMNTRLQVEHPITEELYGVDLVEWMLRQAAGELVLPNQESLVPRGAAIEVRLYAEDAVHDFRPSTGTITAVQWPEGTRVESWVAPGVDVSRYYDPMLAKLITHGESRDIALEKMRAALAETKLWGITNNLSYLDATLSMEAFVAGEVVTSSLSHLAFSPGVVEVIAPGTFTGLQDWPGRLGYWSVGVPPSGPMDDRAHCIVNQIVGNASGAAALECTLTGPTLRFGHDCVIALGGAKMQAMLDGLPVPYWQAIEVRAGQVLSLGEIQGPGMRSYIAVRGGFDAPLYLGARASFALGEFGGPATGILKAGQQLSFAQDFVEGPPAVVSDIPQLTRNWDIAVHYGPHGAPEFFAPDDIDDLFSAEYEVHFNSARTGIRLIGPQPRWTRADGGEAGLHPSNIHDNAYAIGAIDFTGDMPIILGPDGPSLGGFVCPAVVAKDELWKLGQLRPGDKLHFHPVDHVTRKPIKPKSDRLRELPDVVVRRAGDENILVEFGPMAVDFASRLKAHLLMQSLQYEKGLIDCTPGIRSLQIHYNSEVWREDKLLDAISERVAALPSPESVIVPSRIVHLPLSWNDPYTQLAMRKYQELVRPNAPWCPDNIEFIRRINGLSSEAEVQRVLFDASYLVLGLGDVYLGAPVATPLDPRHRLVTTKYNPARTWTPENAVGIGGAYLCVYGMEGPGGYQLVGRTIQMWNRWRKTACFEEPWLLRFFDQIRFFQVSTAELAEAREAFPHGAYPLRIETSTFSLAAHREFLSTHADSITAFKYCQQKAFEIERQRWCDDGLDILVANGAAADSDEAIPVGATPVYASTAGSVWKLETAPGAHVAAGTTILITETMKMEIAVTAPCSGKLLQLRCQPGQVVQAGQLLALIGVT
nr:5-oxoprolinase/urea amidolyase family protein [Rhizomicrobium palustre]